MNHRDLIIGDNRDSIHDPNVLVPIPTRPKAYLNERGPNGKLVYRSNPISWLVDVFACVPFLNFNGSSSQASQDAAAAQTAAAQAASGIPASTLPTAAQANPYNETFGLTTGAPAPTTNPTQVGTFGTPTDSSNGNQPLASVDNPMVQSAPGTAPPKPQSRQQQIIQSDPIYGPFNPQNSTQQNRLQIQQAQQALGVQSYPGLPKVGG